MIQSAKRIMIISHINPDGDTLGSLLGLGLGLLKVENKEVVMVSPDGMPPRYRFLPGSELVLDRYKEKADLAIAVDCGSIKQMGTMSKYFAAVKNSIQIDHHDFGDSFGKHLLVDTEAAAVGEIIFERLKVKSF